MLTNINLKNFAAFDKLAIDFSSRVNVIIGENSCGKTQLLKAAYVLSTIGAEFEPNEKPTKELVERVLTGKFLDTFKPSRLGELFHRGSKEQAQLLAGFSGSGVIKAGFSSNSRKIEVIDDEKNVYGRDGVFIPTKEIISFLDGISNKKSDPTTLKRLFDSTYFELAKKLLNQQSDTIEEKTIWFREEIANELGGQFMFNDASVSFIEGKYKQYKGKHARSTYFSKSGRSDLSTTMTAEGYRKVGVLQRLLENQAIGTGVNGPLLWDEPESNMNPKLMRLLVQILLELSRNGQQIFLATHDYVLLKWFDLLVDEGKDDHVLYHSLYRDEDTNEVKLSTTDDLSRVSPNPIDEAFGFLINKEIENDMGGLGK